MNNFLLKTDKGIESVVTTFSRDGSCVTLYPMVHFGVPEFYENIVSQARNHNRVLYENLGSSIDDENFYLSLLTKNYPDNYRFSLPEIFMMAINLYQSTFARVFGLAEQSVEQLHYSDIENFRTADLNCYDQEVNEQYTVNGSIYDGNQLFYDYIGRILHSTDLLNFMDVIANKSIPEVLRPIYESAITDLTSDSSIMKILAFSEQRELHVINILDAALNYYQNIGIIYGAAHMDYYADHLKKGGYEKSAEQSVLAIPAVPPRLEKHN